MLLLSIWALFAYGVAPLGIATCVLLLSGVASLEKIGTWICSIIFQAGGFRIRLDQVFVLLSLVMFLSEISNHNKYNYQDYSPNDVQDRARLGRARHERNFWISLYILTLWSVALRSSVLLRRHYDAAVGEKKKAA